MFSGDILFTDFHPYMGDGDIMGWQLALDFLSTLGAEKIIPGHGPLSTIKDVADMKAYITVFDGKAKKLAANWAGTFEELVAEMKRGVPARTGGEWIIGANMQAKYLAKKEGEKN